MKTLLSAAAIIALAAGAAQAQPDPNGRDARPDTREAPRQSQPAPSRSYAPPARSYAPAQRGVAPPAQPTNRAPAGAYAPNPSYRGGQYAPGAQTNGYRGPTPGAAPQTRFQPRNQGAPGFSQSDRRFDGANRSGDDRGQWRGGDRNGGDHGQWRGRDGSGWNGQRAYFAERRFNEGGYRYPRGWYPRRWGYGEFLPFGWFAQDYWLDFGSYDLPPPPYGAEWVRVGNDALLVDMASGEVISVEYGLFD